MRHARERARLSPVAAFGLLALLVSPRIAAEASAFAQPARQASLLAELDALLARTSRLRSVRASYRIERAGEPAAEGALELVFRAPDALLVRSRTERGEELRLVRGGVLEVREPGRRPRHARDELAELLASLREVDEELDARFPPSQAELDARSGHAFGLAVSALGTPPSFDFEPVLGGAAPLFGWLAIARRGKALASDQTQLVFAVEGGLRMTVSRASGVLERLEMPGLALVLERAVLDEPVDEQLLALPEPAADSKLVLRAGPLLLARQFGFARGRVFRRLAAEVDAPDFAERALPVLRALHAPALVALFGRLNELHVERAGAQLRALRAGLEQARLEGKAVPADALEHQTARLRAELVRELKEPPETYFVHMQALAGLEPHASEVLLALEKEAGRALFEERLREPTLRRFDELVAE